MPSGIFTLASSSGSGSLVIGLRIWNRFCKKFCCNSWPILFRGAALNTSVRGRFCISLPAVLKSMPFDASRSAFSDLNTEMLHGGLEEMQVSHVGQRRGGTCGSHAQDQGHRGDRRPAPRGGDQEAEEEEEEIPGCVPSRRRASRRSAASRLCSTSHSILASEVLRKPEQRRRDYIISITVSVRHVVYIM